MSDAPIDALHYFRVAAGDHRRRPGRGLAHRLHRRPRLRALDAVRSAALEVWDALAAAGPAFDLHPAGGCSRSTSPASRPACCSSTSTSTAAARRSSPAQMYDAVRTRARAAGEPRTRAPFVGREALRREHARRAPRGRSSASRSTGPRSRRCTSAVGLPPTAPAAASRVAVPVYKGGAAGRQGDDHGVVADPQEADRAGHDRSAALRRWGRALEFEITVEAVAPRRRGDGRATPFFNPPRKTATPPP